jgi:DNA-binding response OmpR family regulator
MEPTAIAATSFGLLCVAARRISPSVGGAIELQSGGTTMKNSLLLEGDQQTMLQKALESAGFLVFDLSEAGRDRVRLRQLWAAVNLLDIRTPRMRGLRIGTCDSPELIVITDGSIAEALTAMRLGAAEILAVPLTSEALRAAIDEFLIPVAGSQPGPTRPPIFVAVESTITDLVRAKKALDRREFDQAERLVRSAINRHPDSAMAHNLLGVLQLRVGDHLAAYHSFQAALRAEWAYESALEKLRYYCDR